MIADTVKIEILLKGIEGKLSLKIPALFWFEFPEILGKQTFIKGKSDDGTLTYVRTSEIIAVNGPRLKDLNPKHGKVNKCQNSE